jgi:hypothetical protein
MNSLFYFDFNTYKQFIDDNIKNVVNKYLLKLKDSDKLVSTKLDYDNLVNFIDCTGKIYFNKCFEIEDLVDFEEYFVEIGEVLYTRATINYYQKYLKYKKKYLLLKKHK